MESESAAQGTILIVTTYHFLIGMEAHESDKCSRPFLKTF